MPDEPPFDETARLVGQYDQHVARALLDYISATADDGSVATAMATA